MSPSRRSWRKSRPRCLATKREWRAKPSMSSAELSLTSYFDRLRNVEPAPVSGSVVRVVGLVVESIGPRARVGEVCELRSSEGGVLPLEVVGFRDGHEL